MVDFADTPPFGLEETQRAAQLLLGCGVRASELKSTLEALGNVAAGGGMSLEQIGIRLSKAFQTGRVTMEGLEPLMNSGINVMGVLGQRDQGGIAKDDDGGNNWFPGFEGGFSLHGICRRAVCGSHGEKYAGH